MREIAFIKQNKSKWMEFEQLIQADGNRNPDDLAQAYIRLLNDLSYSQTYYPKSKTTEYLNSLVAQIYRKIYKTKRIDRNRFVKFYVDEIPNLIYKYRKVVIFAFSIFLFFTFIGAVSAAYDDRFIRLIMGDNYVNMTLENIKNGDPMAVYKSDGSMDSFFGISYNNLWVTIQAYVYGITAGLMTFYVSMQNGIMLGSFQYFCYDQGVFGESLRTIWLHGAMEIFSIVLATACGFILGGSWLFPGTYSRMNSFMIGARDSAKILISVLPFIVIAAFIEVFVTRYSNQMPLIISIFIIIGTLSFMCFYYLIYPFYKHKKTEYGKLSTLQTTEIQ